MPRPHRLTPPQQPDRKAKPGTFRRIVTTFKPYRGTVTIVGVLILIISAIGLINPLLIKVVFDDVILASDEPTDERLQLLWLVAAVLFADLIAIRLWCAKEPVERSRSPQDRRKNDATRR